jgi:hypothetical protein
MSIGESLLSLFGKEDPRLALLRAVGGGGAPAPASPGAPYAAQGGAPGATTTAPAPAGPGARPAPQAAENLEAFKSPPDLASLYGDLLKYQSKATNIDRGVGLLGSAFSQDANRASTLAAFTGEGAGRTGTQGLGDMANLMLELNKGATAQKMRAAQLASLPVIAQKYGLDVETAKYLFDTGKLDSVIAELEKPNRELVKDANGQNILIDKTDASTVGTFGGPASTKKIIPGPNGSQVLADESTGDVLKEVTPADLTNEEREYNAYVDDEIARGTETYNVKSFQDWRMTKPPSMSVTNNIGDKMAPGPKKFAEESGKLFAEDWKAMRDGRKNARDMMNQYDVIDEALDTGVRTGQWGDAELSLRKIGQAIGVDTDPTKVAGGELLKSVTNKMALIMRNPESGMGMPGSVSDRDIEFLKAAQPGIDQTPTGNRTMLDIFRRIEQRKIDIANLADKYVKDVGQLDEGFDAKVKEFADKNPLFEGIDIAPLDNEAKKADIYKRYNITGGK